MSEGGRRHSARERLAVERAREAHQDRRRRAAISTVGAVAGLALVVGLIAYAMSSSQDTAARATAYTGALAPLTRETDGSIVMAKPGATAPLLEIFEDFQCPICKTMENTSGGTIKKLAAEGRVRVRYWPFQLFQSQPLSGNSRRAANAALCAPAAAWVSYHDTLYRNQPAEGTAGFSSKSLIGWGRDLGITDASFATCVDKLQKATRLDQMTKTATTTRGVTGTPTGYLNGTSLDLRQQLLDPTALAKAIEYDR